MLLGASTRGNAVVIFTATLTNEQEPGTVIPTLVGGALNIFAGRSYLNFHTVQFTGGEVRGQITAVPEPSSIALAGMGAIGLIGYGWLRPRRTRRHVGM